MSTSDQIEIMLLSEISDYPLTESKAYATVIITKSINSTLGIRPKKITEEALIRNISRSHNVFYLIKVLQFRAETTMHAENFLINECSDRETVEDVAEHAPESDRVPAFALIIESVNTIDLSTFVIATEQEEVLRVLYFVAKEQADGLDRLLSSVDVITKEQIVGLRGEPTVLKDA